MSSGPFISSFYEDNNGGIRPIRIQPETVTTFNPAATGPATADFARVSGGNSAYGLKARAVNLVRAVGPVTDGYQARATARIPILTPTAFGALSTGQSVDYNGETWTVAGFSSEAGRAG